MTEYTIDPVLWFSERELSYTPKHFIVTRSTLHISSKKWILNTLRGRFSTVNADETFSFDEVFPAFEDPQEAVMYELMWSS